MIVLKTFSISTLTLNNFISNVSFLVYYLALTVYVVYLKLNDFKYVTFKYLSSQCKKKKNK